jgi:hypothetical protein
MPSLNLVNGQLGSLRGRFRELTPRYVIGLTLVTLSLSILA